jgi:cbb3-type cytochrome oxidase subunit 3
MFMQRGATVTMAHAATRNIESVVRRADIVVAAMGRPQIVKGSWIKPGAIVLDVGIDFIEDPSDERGRSESFSDSIHRIESMMNRFVCVCVIYVFLCVFLCVCVYMYVCMNKFKVEHAFCSDLSYCN